MHKLSRLLLVLTVVAWNGVVCQRLQASPKQVVVAQAGSMGGVIGNRGKSASGGIATKRPGAPARTKKAQRTGSRGCPSIVGTWNSWASGLFGQDDTTFKRDGTAIHRSGIPGKWWCENGELRMQWGAGDVERHSLSANRKTITRSDGAVGFRR